MRKCLFAEAPTAAAALRSATTADSSDPFVALSLNAGARSPPSDAAVLDSFLRGSDMLEGNATGTSFSAVGSGQTAGASKDQVLQWFTRLSANKEGVLFEDSVVQIGLKTQYQGTKGRVQLFVGNKSSNRLSDFTMNITWTLGMQGESSQSSGGAFLVPASICSCNCPSVCQ